MADEKTPEEIELEIKELADKLLGLDYYLSEVGIGSYQESSSPHIKGWGGNIL